MLLHRVDLKFMISIWNLCCIISTGYRCFSPQATGSTALQEIAQNVKRVNDDRRKTEEKVNSQAASVLRLKRSYHAPADGRNFGKVSPLCRKVPKKAVEEAKVRCCARCGSFFQLLFELLLCCFCLFLNPFWYCRGYGYACGFFGYRLEWRHKEHLISW